MLHVFPRSLVIFPFSHPTNPETQPTQYIFPSPPCLPSQPPSWALQHNHNRRPTSPPPSTPRTQHPAAMPNVPEKKPNLSFHEPSSSHLDTFRRIPDAVFGRCHREVSMFCHAQSLLSSLLAGEGKREVGRWGGRNRKEKKTHGTMCVRYYGDFLPRAGVSSDFWLLGWLLAWLTDQRNLRTMVGGRLGRWAGDLEKICWVNTCPG